MRNRTKCTSEYASIRGDYLNTHHYRRHVTAIWVQNIPDDALPVEDVEDFDARFENEYRGKREPPPSLIAAIEKEKARALEEKKKADLKRSKKIFTSIKPNAHSASKNKVKENREPEKADNKVQTQKVKDSPAAQDSVYKTAEEYSITKKYPAGNDDKLIFNDVESPLQMHISKFAVLYKDRLLDEQPTCSRYANFYEDTLNNPTHSYIYRELLKRGPLSRKAREYIKALDDRSPGIRYTVPYRRRFKNYDLLKEKTPHNSSSTEMSAAPQKTNRNRNVISKSRGISLINKFEFNNNKGVLPQIYKLDLTEPSKQTHKVNFLLNNNSDPTARTKQVANKNFSLQTSELRSSKSHTDLTADKGESLRSTSRIEKALKKGALLKNQYNVKVKPIQPSKYFIELRNKFEPNKQNIKLSDNNEKKNVAFSKEKSSVLIMRMAENTKSKSQLYSTSKISYPTKVLNKQWISKVNGSDPTTIEKLEEAVFTNTFSTTLKDSLLKIAIDKDIPLRKDLPCITNMNATITKETVYTSDSMQDKQTINEAITHTKQISIENTVTNPNIIQKKLSSIDTGVKEKISEKLVNITDNHNTTEGEHLTKNAILNQCIVKPDKLPYVSLTYAKKVMVDDTLPGLDDVLREKSTNVITTAKFNNTSVKEVSIENETSKLELNKTVVLTDIKFTPVEKTSFKNISLTASNVNDEKILDVQVKSKETSEKITLNSSSNSNQPLITKVTPASKIVGKETVPLLSNTKNDPTRNIKASLVKEGLVKNTASVLNNVKKDQSVANKSTTIKESTVKNNVSNFNNQRKGTFINFKNTPVPQSSGKSAVSNANSIKKFQPANNKATPSQKPAVNSITNNVRKVQSPNIKNASTKKYSAVNTFPSHSVKQRNVKTTSIKDNTFKRSAPNRAYQTQPTGKIIPNKRTPNRNNNLYSHKVKTNLNTSANSKPVTKPTIKNNVPGPNIANKQQSSNGKVMSGRNATKPFAVKKWNFQNSQAKSPKETSTKGIARNNVIVKKVQFPKTVTTTIKENSNKSTTPRPVFKKNLPPNTKFAQAKEVSLKNPVPNSARQKEYTNNNTTTAKKSSTNNSIRGPVNINGNESVKLKISSSKDNVATRSAKDMQVETWRGNLHLSNSQLLRKVVGVNVKNRQKRHLPSKEVIKFVTSRLTEHKRRTAYSNQKSLALPENNYSTV